MKIFGHSTCHFNIKGAISIGNSVICYPSNYKGKQYDLDEAVTLGKFPTCGWASDSYINWLTQNSVNIPNKILGIVNSGINYNNTVTSNEMLAKETATQGLSISTGYNIATNILSIIGDFKMASLLPNIMQNGNSGDVMFADNKNTFEFYHMRCKTENLKIIDDYFSMFGYKVNRIKAPNIKTRQNWNYLEIAPSENIGYGSVPARDMDIINKACRRGITIWHNHENLGNYSLDNSNR